MASFVSGAVFVMVYRPSALISIAVPIILWGGTVNQSMGSDINIQFTGVAGQRSVMLH